MSETASDILGLLACIAAAGVLAMAWETLRPRIERLASRRRSAAARPKPDNQQEQPHG